MLSFTFYAAAHTTLFYAGANGKVNDQGVCIVPSPKYGNAPVLDLDSEDMRCRNSDFSTKDIERCPVEAGGNLTVVWRHIHNSVKVKVMSYSHNGPCIIMMAPLESNGKGDAWFKIYEEGYDSSIKKWCTNKVIDNDGYLDVKIPENIPSGEYLVRTELFALPQPGTGLNSQQYPNCVVVSVAGGKGSSLPELYPIPGIYKFGDPGVMFDRGKDPTTYPFPGPPLFTDSPAAALRNCHAHTYLTHLTINGTKLEELRCTLPLWDNENYPVLDPSSDDLRCKTSDMQSTKTETCWVPAGSKVTLHMTESGGESRFISPSHRGPILTYMAPLESNGEGNVWFKIYEDGYDGDSDVWAVDKIVKAKGYWDVTIPSDIAPGDYLLRGEVIALHEADRVYGADDSAGAQYYPGCARIHPAVAVLQPMQQQPA
ncbi:hypothetical protein LPJ79_004577 [Coemansia sp. RSA 1821]|nr:hypothetical protein LPJ79_004577 [Coemansia sp. RSA 1821]